MRRVVLAAALLAGCASGPDATAPAPKPGGGCSCEQKICACPHCKGGAAKCPCREIEKPK